MTVVPQQLPVRSKGREIATPQPVPPAIQWHEGMLLAPQHFQTLALRHETLMHYHAVAISPFHWGVRSLAIDPVKLADGIVRIDQLDAVMPDGLVVSHGKHDGELSLTIAANPDDLRRRPLRIHLAVVGRNASVSFNERYRVEYRGDVADENRAAADMPVAVLQPLLHLTEGDPDPKYVSFPIAEVTHGKEGFAQTSFEPPWLRVTDGSRVYDLCASVARRLREKAAFLADQTRAQTGPHKPQVLDVKQQVHCLVGELPPFEALLDSNAAHPFTLYLAFCSLFGHVSGLSRSLIPPTLAPYDHNNVIASFRELKKATDEALDEGIQESFSDHAFVESGNEFHIAFKADWQKKKLLLGVYTNGTTEREVAEWVSRAVIARRDEVQTLLRNRDDGVRRTYVAADRADFVPPRGMTLFELAFTDEHPYPSDGEDLVVVHPKRDAQRPGGIVLFVRKSEKAG